jgi:hypothetical protein
VQGVYPKYNGGVNLNHRNKSINVFGFAEFVFSMLTSF